MCKKSPGDDNVIWSGDSTLRITDVDKRLLVKSSVKSWFRLCYLGKSIHLQGFSLFIYKMEIYSTYLLGLW